MALVALKMEAGSSRFIIVAYNSLQSNIILADALQLWLNLSAERFVIVKQRAAISANMNK